MMRIRPYRPSDCGAMAELFYHTVHTVNAADYTPRQLDAWADGQVDLTAWDRSFRAHCTLVAEEGGVLIGFGDITADGYLDRLYVHHLHQRQGALPRPSVTGWKKRWGALSSPTPPSPRARSLKSGAIGW